MHNDYSKLDITGNTYGRLKALKKIEGTKSKWLFVCECGKEVELTVGKVVCKNGQVSCGCLKHENVLNNIMKITKHGESGTKLYHVYNGLMNRCYNQNNSNYKRYGGRGITVCDEWKNSYDSFKEWAYSNGFDEELGRKDQSIDRIDNSKGYSPDNCRWTTSKEQQKNRDCTKLYEYQNKLYSASEFADIYNITDKTFVYRRLSKGQTLEYILNDWIRMNNVPKEYTSIEEYAKKVGLHYGSVTRMLRNGKLKGEKFGRKWYVLET